MPIRQLDDSAAVARLNSIRFSMPVAEVAERLARWQAKAGGFVVPIQVELSRLKGDGSTTPRGFKERAKLVRAEIANRLGLDAVAARKLTFRQSSRDAWYIGPRPSLTEGSMLNAVRDAPDVFIELMLKRHLIEAAAFDDQETFVTGGFGPSVYLGAASEAGKRRFHLAEAEFNINVKHGHLLCDVTSKVFARKSKSADAAAASASELAAVGHGHLLPVTRIVSEDFIELDARQYPLVGVSLHTTKVRQCRLYYLNVLHEFALDLFAKAEISVVQDTFVASHYVDGGYIPLAPLASLLQPIEVVNATQDPMDVEALKPLQAWPEFFSNGYHVAGNKKVHFQPPVFQASSLVPERLTSDVNYLFLNGPGDDENGSVRVAKVGDAENWQTVSWKEAYAGLSRGDIVADAYTMHKFRHLMDAPDFSISMQGINCSPLGLASMMPGKARPEDRPLQEALKRCLVELSLKECLRALKPVPVPDMPREFLPSSLTLLATRQIRMSGREIKQLVSEVQVKLDERGIMVQSVRRSPWSAADDSVIDMVSLYPFLQPDNRKPIRDNQFWVIDQATGRRLTAWAGEIVPRIILNDAYSNIEAALAEQSDHIAQGKQSGRGGKYYSKDRRFNLLPYYMSMHKAGYAPSQERVGVKMALEDRGGFVRVFVPPAGGINGAGDAFSGMRDVMVYEESGENISEGLLQESLVNIYLHTMTNGVLVGGDNSKMSVLEKLARLAVGN
ncbi:hypothetical protein [Cupriavidus sp. D384]|uniref:hypothetical protein n=1 Tax=Cupriavidus sp. D384 TaxID=1538095 RepID=UPI000835DB5D|nr:hypothetical protein [Cupriavidus sp. D384]